MPFPLPILGLRGPGRYISGAGGGEGDGGFQEPPVVTVIASGDVTISGKVKPGSFGKFVYPLATVAGGRKYTIQYDPDFSQLAMQGKLAMVGFGLKSSNDFHIVGLRGNGTTGLTDYKVYGTSPNGWNKQTGHTVSQGSAPANGTQAGPNWIQIGFSSDGTTYTFRTSANGTTWTDEYTASSPTPFTDADGVPTFGVALWFNNADAGPFSVVISQFADQAESPPPAEITMPQGRLTLTSGAPVADSVPLTGVPGPSMFYAPYVGDQVPIYNGTSYTMTTFTELSQTITDATKSPAGMTVSTTADFFVWSDSGTIRCTRGPNYATVRGTGAGTSELVLVGGIWLNANAITNGPAAQRGTFVGTVYSLGNGTGNAFFEQSYGIDNAYNFAGVWNMYNRVRYATDDREGVDSIVTVSNGVRVWVNNANRLTVYFVSGLKEDCFAMEGGCPANPAVSNRACGMGVNVDTVSAFGGIFVPVENSALAASSASFFCGSYLGIHTAQAVEVSQTGTATIYGDAGAPGSIAAGISATLMM
jgi:hypothetical protein